MVGIIRSVIIRCVTAVAICRQIFIVVVHVALAARSLKVLASQWEAGLIVVEFSIGPQNRVMTKLTLLWESGLLVVGIVGSIPIFQMARHTSGGQTFVHAIGVTGFAIQADVSAGQREVGFVVIKLRPSP